VRPVLLSGKCPKTISLFLVRKSAFVQVGGFDPLLQAFQDTDLWIRLADHWHFDAIDEALAIVHSHDGERITTSLEPRIAGLDAFVRKWGPEMEAVMGEEGVRRFVREHLAVAYGNEVLRLVAAKDTRQARAAARNYFKHVGLSRPRQALGLLIAILLGPKAHIRIRNASRHFVLE
jgi:hypothetical protein